MTTVKKLDPKGLVITRRRKKWKFAYYDSFSNCFAHHRSSDPADTLKQLRDYLPARQPIVLEIGAGNAQFSLELASQNQKLNFIAIDIKSDRLYTSAKQAIEQGIKNIAFLRTHINEIDTIFPKGSIDQVWLTFPDPFQRMRSAKHRLTHPHFLAKYQQLLSKGNPLHIKTDNLGLFHWSLEQCVSSNWQIQELSFDLHESDLPETYKIETAYERRFRNEGTPINYATLVSN